MNRRTQVLIGLSLVVLGIGAWTLSLAEGEASVRRVEDVVAEPARYASGEHVLLGVPQPPLVPVVGDEGKTLVENPDWADHTSHTVRWTDFDGAVWYSKRSVNVTIEGDTVHWTYRNETRELPADPLPAYEATVLEWTTTGGRAFAIQAFHDSTADTPRIWGVYSGPLKEPMQPKPSQFTGSLMTHLPDGTPVPDGAYLYDVQDFKAGCSSKFLPPEEKERLESSGDL
ncbi:MAG TPA: hypothetical protein VM327_09335 [Candidatus Thermoplasmatota archaeon]|nr:hypothetical protein [Candidatus Thermoplasmatota archaeon]